MPATSPLAPTTAAAMLRASAAALAAEVRALPDPILRWHPAPGEWCVKDVLGHIIEAERRGFGGRIRIILESDRPALQRWNQDEVAKARNDCERDGGELAAELLRMREEGAAFVATLGARDLERIGRHPVVGDLSVRDVLQEWVHHDRNHLKQILTNVQAYVWPHMGNAQRFSAGSAASP